MAAKKLSPAHDRRLQEEVHEEFRNFQRGDDAVLIPPARGSKRGKYQPARLPRRIEDGQYIELSDELSEEQVTEPAPIPDDTRFIAEKLLEAVVYVATGKGLVPRVIPVRADPVWRSRYLHAGAADGVRHLFESDERHISAAFKAIFGVAPERYWEIVLELALRDALVLRHVLPERTAFYTRGGKQVATTPTPPTAANILAIVRERALPGTVPEYLTSEMIEIALAKCTDGRGGGRGDGKKISVRKWIADLKKKAEAMRRKTRGSKRT